MPAKLALIVELRWHSELLPRIFLFWVGYKLTKGHGMHGDSEQGQE